MKKSIFFIVVLILISCNTDNCSSKLDFKLDYHLFDSVNIDDSNYCDLVLQSLDKNRSSIVKISKVDLSDFASYQHGAVLVNIIEKYGEEEYVNEIFNNLSTEEKKMVIASLKAGIDFYTSSKKRKIKNLDTLFPMLIDSHN